MTKGKGRLRSVTLREAQQFAGQAEEYLQLDDWLQGLGGLVVVGDE